jgi:hypothetical protein
MVRIWTLGPIASHLCSLSSQEPDHFVFQTEFFLCGIFFAYISEPSFSKSPDLRCYLLRDLLAAHLLDPYLGISP